MMKKRAILNVGIIISFFIANLGAQPNPTISLISLVKGNALNEERLTVLLNGGANIHALDEQALREAVFVGNIDQVALLLENNAIPDDQMLAHAVQENAGPIIKLLLDAALHYKPLPIDKKKIRWLLRYAQQRGLTSAVNAIKSSRLYYDFISRLSVDGAQQFIRAVISTYSLPLQEKTYLQQLLDEKIQRDFSQQIIYTRAQLKAIVQEFKEQIEPTSIEVFPVYSVVRDQRNRPIGVKTAANVFRIFETSTAERLKSDQRIEIDHRSYIKDPLSAGVLLDNPIARNYTTYLQQLLSWQRLQEVLKPEGRTTTSLEVGRSDIELFIRNLLHWPASRQLPQKLQISIDNIIDKDPIQLTHFNISYNEALAIVVLVLNIHPQQAKDFLSRLVAAQPDLIVDRTMQLYNLEILKDALEAKLREIHAEEQDRLTPISPLTVDSTASD